MSAERERQIEALIDGIYDASMGGDGWSTALVAVLKAVGASAGCLFFQDQPCNAAATSIMTTVDYPTAAPAQYLAHFAARDVRLQAAAALPFKSVLADEIDFDFTTIERSEIQNDFYRPMRLGRGAGIRLFGSSHRSGFLTMHRASNGGSFKPDEIAILERLGPHVARSLQVRRQVAQAEAVNAGLLSGLDHFQTAVLLVDREERVLVMNKAADALLSRPDCPLRLPGSHLTAVEASDAVGLRRLIGSAFASLTGVSSDPPGVLRLSGSDGVAAFALMAAPLRPTNGLFGRSEPFLLLFVTEAAVAPATDQIILAQQFRLSAAEAAVAAELAAGYQVEDIAERRGVSSATVRVQVKSILAKMDVNRQSQVVGMIARSLAALRLS